MTNLNYYKILRVRPTATPKEIRAAFIDLAILFDQSKDPIKQQLMELIDEAHYVLRDPGRRAKYDLESSTSKIENYQDIKPSVAEKIIDSWYCGFTIEEQEYINKIHKLNRLVKISIAFGAILFVWFVISGRIDISLLIMLGLALIVETLSLIYKIQNLPPPPEVWGAEK